MGGTGTPKGRYLVTCIFCGITMPTSIEDVIPKWARYALDPTSSVTVRAEPGNVTARMQHLVVTLHGMVCEACNNGWMHDLEERVKPFLKPMLVNKHGADLDLAQQRDLARWAVMKVLLMEHVMRQKYPQLRATAGYVPSEPELAWLMAEACPPLRSRVWLGAFDPQGTYAVQTKARLLQSAPQPGGGRPGGLSYDHTYDWLGPARGLHHQLRPCRCPAASGVRRPPAVALQPGPDAHLAYEAAGRALATHSSRQSGRVR
jgi:hypothetical protein